MLNSFSVKRTVLLFVILHTAISIILSAVLLRSAIPSGNLLMIIACSAVIVAITLYTAKMIVKSVNEELTSQANHLSSFSLSLQTTSEHLKQYANELEKRAKMMQDNQNAIEENILTIGDYGQKMKDLVESINVINCADIHSVRNNSEDTDSNIL